MKFYASLPSRSIFNCQLQLCFISLAEMWHKEHIHTARRQRGQHTSVWLDRDLGNRDLQRYLKRKYLYMSHIFRVNQSQMSCFVVVLYSTCVSWWSGLSVSIQDASSGEMLVRSSVVCVCSPSFTSPKSTSGTLRVTMGPYIQNHMMSMNRVTDCARRMSQQHLSFLL